VAAALVPSPSRAGAPADAAAECAQAFHRGDYPRAVTLARARLLVQPREVTTLIVLARAEAAQGRFEAAYEGFQRALRVDPRNTDALYYLAITAGVLAQSEYERLFALAPGSGRAHQLRGQSYEAQGRPHEAVAAYQAALEADAQSVELLVALGDLMRSQLRLEEAVAYYARAAALAPHRYDVLYGLGVAHSFRREYGPAVERLREALVLDPGSAPARFNLGRALLMSGQAQAAAAELEAAIARAPRMREAHYMLGRAYQALGREPEAERAFARARELASEGVSTGEATPEPDPR
jgi:tetratricopeptide (TPR) repeat protein